MSARRAVSGAKPAPKKAASKKAALAKRARKAKPATPVADGTLVITLDQGISEILQAMSASRGVDVPTLIRVALRNLAQKSNFYGLDTKLAFGKYRGEAVDTVIRCDPGYVAWMLKTFEGVQFSWSALDLLQEIQATAGDEQ